MTHVHIGVSIDAAGRHPAAWREPDAEPDRLFTADHAVALARLAERGLLDYVALDDSFQLQEGGEGVVRGELDALLTLARVAPQTSSIGLVPTVTTTHTEPFHVSKNVATLDFVSLGRAGWLVDVSSAPQEAFHFGRGEVAPSDDLYDEAGEAIDVVGRLWDSWEDDAVIRDVATGRYIDREKLHYTDFEGRFFSVRGPSITPRSPQGRSVVAIEARTERALAVGIEHADVVIVDVATIDEALQLRHRIEAGALAAGRAASDVTLLATIEVLLDSDDAAAEATRVRLDAVVEGLPSTLTYTGGAVGLADLIEAWSAADAVDGFHIRPTTLPATLTHFVDEVVPLLQGRGLFRTRYEGTTLRERFGLVRPESIYSGGPR